MTRFFTILIALSLLPLSLTGQVSVSEFPADLQLYPRDLVSNQATITASGTVDLGAITYSEMRLKIYRDNVLQATESVPMVGTGITPFNLSYDITAELNNYKFELYGFNGSENLLESADSVVAGDVYVIQGQSNAEAPLYAGSASGEENSFIRVFGRGLFPSSNFPSLIWHKANGDGDRFTDGNAGQWGLKMANQLVTNQNIPVAVFNGAHGGRDIAFFQRNDADNGDLSTNYGRLLSRLQATNSDQNVRGLFWFQGEDDANAQETENYYKGQWADLYNDWGDDISVEKFYIVQIREVRFYTFDEALPIQEAQRVLADSLSDVEIISTSALTQHTDEIHFPFANGFETLGEQAYRLVDRDMYGAADDNTSSPNIVSGSKTATTEISLLTEKAGDVLSVGTGIESHFRLEGSSETITNVSVSGNQIILTLSGDPAGATGVTYGPPLNSNSSVTNANGYGLVAFSDFPFATLPVELLSFDAKALAASVELNWITVTEKNNAHFEIQRSLEGQPWQNIGLVAGAGDSDQQIRYAFADDAPQEGINRYRLKQVDFDGGFSLSPV
ncbi:MAG: sialate O-acetylesterase, partial [Bacteroidota bacterium]